MVLCGWLYTTFSRRARVVVCISGSSPLHGCVYTMFFIMWQTSGCFHMLALRSNATTQPCTQIYHHFRVAGLIGNLIFKPEGLPTLSQTATPLPRLISSVERFQFLSIFTQTCCPLALITVTLLVVKWSRSVFS